MVAKHPIKHSTFTLHPTIQFLVSSTKINKAVFMSFLLPILIASLAAGSPQSNHMVTMQALHAVPAGWEIKAAAPPQMTIDMHIGLKQSNLDKLEQRALEISDPEHVNYGKHMSKTDIDALTAPSQASVDAVTRWLASHGIHAGEINSGFLKVTIPVLVAEEMLHTNYSIYYKAETENYALRTTMYSVPKYVQSHISTIQPTTLFTDFSMGRPKKSATINTEAMNTTNLGKSACNTGGFTPACLRENYNISGYTPTNITTMGVTGFLGEAPSQESLSLYLQKYTDIPKNSSYTVVSINGGVTAANGDGEADLDIQIVKGLTYPIDNIFYSTKGYPPFKPDEGTPENQNEPYLDWLQYMATLDKPPQTISISYGDDEQTVPRDYAETVCTEFMKLGARGVSILVASGDFGVAGQQGACTSNDGTNSTQFLPQFPASCPWVTTVGGTTLYNVNESGSGGGGGGFSNYFSRPIYQMDPVNSYIDSLGGQFQGYYNTTGRGYPDLAAGMNNYPIFENGSKTSSGGTSASCPAVASIIALLNDYLVSNGKAPLGFLNPFLYKKGASGLRDITKGYNNDCVFTPAFPATKGWDASTGLGVPDFGKLKTLV